MSRRDDFRDIAKSVPFDNSTNGFTSTEVQGAIEELNNKVNTSASPGFSFGRSGQITKGSFLQNETVPSNVSGRWVYISNAQVKKVFVTNESIITYSIEIMYHYGNEAGLTSLGIITVTSDKGGSFSVNWPVPSNSQLAIRIDPNSANNPKNVIVGLELAGTN